MDVNSLQKLEFLCGSKEKTKHKYLLILQSLLLFHWENRVIAKTGFRAGFTPMEDFTTLLSKQLSSHCNKKLSGVNV